MTILLLLLALAALAALAPRYGSDSRDLGRTERSRDDLWMRHAGR